MRPLKKSLLYVIAGLALAFTIHTFFEIKSLPKRFEFVGKIDESSCDAELLKDVNSNIVKIVEDLSHTLFFKIFRVNLFKDCPFWVQEFLCTSPLGKCEICKCNEDEIPLPWRTEKTDLVATLQEDIFYQWEPSKNISIQWHAEEKDSEQGIYVDLKKNPEVFTGYQGQNIWAAIYGENCFKGTFQDMCSEERLLNRIISGLHTSISTQLSEYYNEHKHKTHPNVNLFFEKVGNYPERMANLYFAHTVLLRAINRAHEHIKNYNYDTGNFIEDLETKRLIDEMYAITLQRCDNPFDEKELFADMSAMEVNKNFINYFHNISRIMDCVECETCKVYGKLQTYGIAAALKILFAEKFTGEEQIDLKRNELIALMVTFYKFSTSISYIDKMFERRYNRSMGMFQDIIVALIVFVSTSLILIKIFQDKTKKLTGQMRENFKAFNDVDNDKRRRH